MKRVLIGAVVGGVVLFVWQYAAWMFLGIHELDQEPVLAQEAAVATALEGTKRGVYWIPGINDADLKEQGDAYKAWEKKHEQGPRAFINYDPEGGPAMAPAVMAIGAGINVLMMLVVVLLLNAAGIRGFFGRFLFVAGFGVFLALAMDAQNWNWMNYPADWTLAWIVDHIAGMAIVGVVLALIVKPGGERLPPL